MAYTSRDTVNYLGELFLVGQFKTPFLNIIGGVDGANAEYIKGFEFPLASGYTLSAGSQPAITEDASVVAGTPTTISRNQDVNTVQIFKEDIQVSYAKLVSSGEIAGIANVDMAQRVRNELEFQKMAHLKQMAVNMNYTFLNGTYQKAINSGTAAKTKGVITGVSTNLIAGGGAVLTKAILDSMFKSMADNGADFENVILFVNSFQKQKISDIYGFQPESRVEGGVNIESIICDFGRVGVVYDPNVPAAKVAAIDVAHCKPVFALVEGQPPVFYEDLAKTAMSNSGQLVSIAGINYGLEEKHGVIENLSVS